jgi:restriction endonuclease S subunit
VVPPLAVQDAIREMLVSLDEKVDIHERISQSTARLRDTLAPLLITGAIGRDAERLPP